jgi:hypothetical protein
VVSWTIPKTDRFKLYYKKPINDSIYNTMRTENSRYTTQGYGKRYDFITPQAKVYPAPNRYKIVSEVEKNLKERKGFSLTIKPKEIVLS